MERWSLETSESQHACLTRAIGSGQGIHLWELLAGDLLLPPCHLLFGTRGFVGTLTSGRMILIATWILMHLCDVQDGTWGDGTASRLWFQVSFDGLFHLGLLSDSDLASPSFLFSCHSFFLRSIRIHFGSTKHLWQWAFFFLLFVLEDTCSSHFSVGWCTEAALSSKLLVIRVDVVSLALSLSFALCGLICLAFAELISGHLG